MPTPEEIDRICLAYLDACDRRDLSAMRSIRERHPEAGLALGEVLDGLIHEAMNPDVTEQDIDRAVERKA